MSSARRAESATTRAASSFAVYSAKEDTAKGPGAIQRWPTVRSENGIGAAPPPSASAPGTGAPSKTQSTPRSGRAPAQPRLAPPHGFGPRQGRRDRLRDLRQQVHGRPALALDDREMKAPLRRIPLLALRQRFEPRRAEEALDGALRRADARPAPLLAPVGLALRDAARAGGEAARPRRRFDAGAVQAAFGQRGAEQAREVRRRAALRPRRELLRAEIRAAVQAPAASDSSQLSQQTRASARTRPIYAARSATPMTPRASSMLNRWLAAMHSS